MQDVAAVAKVSITTVSHVLNNTRPIALETRARVQKAIQELGYYQNTSARCLVRGQSNVLGLIISNIENPFFAPLIKGFNDVCQKTHFEVILAMTNHQEENAEAAVRRMIQHRVSGAAIMSAHFDAKLVDCLLARDIPVVLLDDPNLRDCRSSVRIDYSSGIAQAMKRLRAFGHRDVGLISGPLKLLPARRFHSVVMETARAYQMRVVGEVEGNDQPDGGATAVQELLAQVVSPTAVLCANDLTAIGAMSETLRLGWKVPDDLSIVGVDDIVFAQYSYPSLSTIRVPLEEIGHSAFRLLQTMVGGNGSKAGMETTVPTEFIARNSIGPVKRRGTEKESTTQ
jgi:LacI family transcriptional regulator